MSNPAKVTLAMLFLLIAGGVVWWSMACTGDERPPPDLPRTTPRPSSAGPDQEPWPIATDPYPPGNNEEASSSGDPSESRLRVIVSDLDGQRARFGQVFAQGVVHALAEDGTTSVPIATKVLVVRCPECVPIRDVVSEAQRQAGLVEVTLTKGLRYHGFIVDPNAAPVPAIRIHIERGGVDMKWATGPAETGLDWESVGGVGASGKYRWTVQTNEAGRFDVAGLLPGRHTILAAGCGWRPRRAAAAAFDPQQDVGRAFPFCQLFVQAVITTPDPPTSHLAASNIAFRWGAPRGAEQVSLQDPSWEKARVLLESRLAPLAFRFALTAGPSSIGGITNRVTLSGPLGDTVIANAPWQAMDRIDPSLVPIVALRGFETALGTVKIRSLFMPLLSRVSPGQPASPALPPTHREGDTHLFQGMVAGEYIVHRPVADGTSRAFTDVGHLSVVAGEVTELDCSDRVTDLSGVRVTAKDRCGDATSAWWLEIHPERCWVSGPATGSEVLVPLKPGDHTFFVRSLDGTLLAEIRKTISDGELVPLPMVIE